MDRKTVFAHIDHTILRPEATAQEVDRVCREAVDKAASSTVNAAASSAADPTNVCTTRSFDSALVRP